MKSFTEGSVHFVPRCKRVIQLFLLFILFTLVVACDDGTHYAPITEMSAFDPIPKTGTHQVTKGETLYEVAWRYGLDYRSLAKFNHIRSPYQLKTGQALHLQSKKKMDALLNEESNDALQRTGALNALKVKQQTAQAELHPVPSVSKEANEIDLEPQFSSSHWLWPAKGKIVLGFSSFNKGLNIVGQEGDGIYAVAPGKVVYSGSGLKRYGNLIILKHNSTYLTAYAHNKVVFVQEGDWVKKGQKIAEMGNTGTDKVMLHFEVRRAGKPVDPLTLLKAPS